MPIDRMLTDEEPVAELVGRVLQEAGIEYVFGISGGHTGRIVGGPAQNPEFVAHGDGARGVARRRDGRGLRPADAASRRADRARPLGAGQRHDRHDRGVPFKFAHAVADRLLRCLAAAIARAVSAGDRRLWKLGCAAGVLRRNQAGNAGDRSRQCGAGDAACDQARDFRTGGTGGGVVQPGFAGRHAGSGFRADAVSHAVLSAAAAAAGRCRSCRRRGRCAAGGTRSR